MAAKKRKAPEEEANDFVDILDGEDDDRLVGDDVTLQTLERTVGRATKFLGGLASSGVTRACLARRGFSAEDFALGRRRLMAVLTPTPSPTENADELRIAAVDEKVAEAIETLDALDDGHFAIAQRALAANHPAQHDALFFELSASKGYAAVVGWRTFLNRLAPMRESKDPEDRAAVALLAKRGLHAAELKRIEKLVNVAEAIQAEIPTIEAATENEEEVSSERLASLRALRAWFIEWFAVAKVEVRSKQLRIGLGISKRAKPVKRKPDQEGSPTPTE